MPCTTSDKVGAMDEQGAASSDALHVHVPYYTGSARRLGAVLMHKYYAECSSSVTRPKYHHKASFLGCRDFIWARNQRAGTAFTIHGRVGSRCRGFWIRVFYSTVPVLQVQFLQYCTCESCKWRLERQPRSRGIQFFLQPSGPKICVLKTCPL